MISLKDKVLFKSSDVLFIEATVVGYILHNGKKTYRLLIDDDVLLDADESSVMPINDWLDNRSLSIAGGQA